MKKLSEMYKLYRELPIFKALFQSLVELGEQELLPIEVMPSIVHMYDQVVVDLVRSSKEQYNFTGKLLMYRILKDHSWFVLTNVSVYVQPTSAIETTNKKGKKVTKLGKRLGKLDKVKLWSYDPVNDSSVEQVDIETNRSPYVIEVEKKVVQKKKKEKLSAKKENTTGYNPLIHATVLGTREKAPGKEDFSLPMPYNEKLRKGGAENSLAIATSQLGAREVLKGRYRKKPKEYPYRCVEFQERPRVDLRVVSGRWMVKRKYMTLMKNQDKMLAEMAVGAGGSLALTAHNVHVVEEDVTKEEMEVVRDSYGTRRKNKIEHATFDTEKNFAVVKVIPKKKVEKDSSDSDTSDYESSDEEDEELFSTPPLVEAVNKTIESKCKPKSRQVDLGSGQKDVNVDGAITSLEVPNQTIVEGDEFAFLDDLVMDVRMVGENLNEDNILNLAVLDVNNNCSENLMTVDLEEPRIDPEFEGIDSNSVLDLFNSQQVDVFTSNDLADLDQTLDTDI